MDAGDGEYLCCNCHKQECKVSLLCATLAVGLPVADVRPYILYVWSTLDVKSLLIYLM